MIRALGTVLRGWRSGPDHRVAADVRFAYAPVRLTLTSPAFADGGTLPGPASPPLAWDAMPAGVRMLALVVEDLDAPWPRPLVHAVAYGIDPATRELAAGALDGPADGDGLVLGLNSLRRRAYLPPTPLPGHGPHRYAFALIGAGFVPRFDQAPSRGRLLDALAGNVIAFGELTGIREA